MKGSDSTKWGVLLLCVSLAFAVGGCAKKQTVKAQDGAAGTGAAGGSGGAAGGSGGTGTGSGLTGSGVSTEKVDGAGTAGGTAGGTGADGAPLTPAQVAQAEALKGRQITEETKSDFSDIRFDFDQYAIRADAKPVLEKVAGYLRTSKGNRIVIEGHCDERGTSEYNMALGERRAEAARKYLVSLGAEPGKLSTVSLGKEKPLDPGHDEMAWAKNRRAHFVLP